MSDFLPLGKPIKAPEPAPAPDQYERFTSSHGDKLMRNKRTGAIETAPPQKIVEPEPEPVPQPEVVYVYGDVICGLLKAQDAEFPLNEFGSL